MMAKEPDLSQRDKAIPKEEKKKNRAHYPQWEFMVTAGFDSLNVMGKEGWEYLELWDADASVTAHGLVVRKGVEPFFIWRRELD